MDDAPIIHQYRRQDREELFDFIREALPGPSSERVIGQWLWRYESSPATLPDDLDVFFIRINGKMVGLSAAYRLRMWMGGIECVGESRGSWTVHPDYRGRNLWQKVGNWARLAPPVQFGWSRLPPRVGERLGRPSDPVRPLVRVLDAGPLFENLTHSRMLVSIGTAATTSMRYAFSRWRRPSTSVLRLSSFDERADRLWERARRPNSAMLIRDRHYLNWRYCQRPDASYILYGAERASELEGFLVARTTTYRGMRWGYLVDFLAPENDGGVLSPLIAAALDDFRGAEVAAVSCFATDHATRSELFRNGFFPAPQRKPIRFMRRMSRKRPELAKFMALKLWYLTMGDGDLEMHP